MEKIIQIVCTHPTREDAEQTASLLVEKRLAACAQVSGPLTSIYRWQGKIEKAEEWSCVIKTVASAYEAVERTIRENHSYDVPEILAFEAVNGWEKYRQWVAEETKI